MNDILKNKLQAFFYRSTTGHEPVREWLKCLSKDDKKVLGEEIKTVQMGWPIGMPLVRSLGKSLWEIRANLQTGRTARIIFFMYQGSMVLLHGFIKKTRKTPAEDIEVALKRKRKIEEEGR